MIGLEVTRLEPIAWTAGAPEAPVTTSNFLEA